MPEEEEKKECCKMTTPGGSKVSGCCAPCLFLCCMCCCEPMFKSATKKLEVEIHKAVEEGGQEIVKKALENVEVSFRAPEGEEMEGRKSTNLDITVKNEKV